MTAEAPHGTGLLVLLARGRAGRHVNNGGQLSTACTPRMLSVLRDLARHPGGMTTPELAERHNVGARTRQAAVVNCFKTVRGLEYRGLVCRAGKVRKAIIWQLTDEGRAVAAEAGPAEALTVIASMRQAGYGPHTPYDVQAVRCHTLRAAGCTDRQIADLFGIHRQGVIRRIKHFAAGERYDIRLGTAGSVSVLVNIRRPAALAEETRARIQELIKDLEALGDSGSPKAPDLLDEASGSRQ